MHLLGISGAAVAWLGGLCLVAAATLHWHLRSLQEHAAPRLSLVRSTRHRVSDAQLPAMLTEAGLTDVTVEARLSTVSDTDVLLVHYAGLSAVLKAAHTTIGAGELDREARILAELACAGELEAAHRLFPKVLASWGDPTGRALLLTTRLPGQPPHSATAREILTDRALAAIGPLRRLGRRSTIADDVPLARVVDEPGRTLGEALRGPRRAARLDRVLAELQMSLSGQVVTLGWVHGDFYPGNVLAGPGGAIEGIVDWAQAHSGDLPLLDVAHWLLTTEPGAGRRPLGGRICDRLSGSCWTEEEQKWLCTTMEPLPSRTVLLLVWLRHVATNLEKSGRYAASPIWLRTNVYLVLEAATR